MAQKTIGLFALVGALLISGPAFAEQAQCRFGVDPWYDCELARDGEDFAFNLTDGRTLVFHMVEEGQGYVYLDRDAGHGNPEGKVSQWTRPRELGDFRPIEDEAGCWAAVGRTEEQFCVKVLRPAG